MLVKICLWGRSLAWTWVIVNDRDAHKAPASGVGFPRFESGRSRHPLIMRIIGLYIALNTQLFEVRLSLMSTLNGQHSTTQRVVARFTKYLNGPLGKTVLENLDEGESFLLQTSEHTLRVTKVRGRAVVELAQPDIPKENWLINVQS